MEAIRTFHTKGKSTVTSGEPDRRSPSARHTPLRELVGGCPMATACSDGGVPLAGRGLCVITVRGSNIPGGRYPCCVSTFRLRLQRTHCIFNCGLSNQLVLSNEVPPLPLSPSPPLPFPSPSSLPRLLPGLDTLGNP